MEEEEDAGNSSKSAGSAKRPDLADLMTSSSGSDHSSYFHTTTTERPIPSAHEHSPLIIPYI